MQRLLNYFSKFEIILWSSSTILIMVFFAIFDRTNYLTLIASVIGITSLIFGAKGNPVGQVLIIVFSLLYGYISFSFAYYGEMITYLGMTLPMAIFALISWLRHPYKGNRAQVKVNNLHKVEYLLMCIPTLLITLIFYFILDFFNTANLIPSTLSVTTSFMAVYLSARRSSLFALAYAANDIILIILWIMASLTETRYISVVACFVAFIFNDIYGFINWQKMKKQQHKP